MTVWSRSSREGWLKWRGVVCILGHFMKKKKKKGCNHGSKPRGGLNYAWLNKAQGYQRAMSQQTQPHSGAPNSRRSLLRGTRGGCGGRPENKQGHKNVAPDKSLDCVMTSAGTLKLNFSEAFERLLKRKHSHSHEVKWYITQFTLTINHLERRDGLWSSQRWPTLSTENDLLTNRGHDFSNKHDNNSLGSCLWFLSYGNKVSHSCFMKRSPHLHK